MKQHFPDGVENLLAAQTLFPIAGVDEMLGRPGDRSDSELPDEHANLPNELAQAAAGFADPARIERVHKAMIARLFAPRLSDTDVDPDDPGEALLTQPWFRDGSQTVEQIIQATIAKLGENVQVGRFSRFEI